MPYHTPSGLGLYRSYCCWVLLLSACGAPREASPSGLAIMGGNAHVSPDHPLTQRTVQLSFEGRGGPEVCTGTLLRPRWVLTAGHCMSSLFRVYSYQGSRRDHESSVLGHPVPLGPDIVDVEGWKASAYKKPLSDLLLVRLAQDLPFPEEQSVSLPLPKAAGQGSERWTIVGTGAHLDQVNVLHELRTLSLKELTIDESLHMISSPGRPINKGDSGGGLFRGEGPYELLGVLSGSMDYRARWTHVPAYSQRIQETIEESL